MRKHAVQKLVILKILFQKVLQTLRLVFRSLESFNVFTDRSERAPDKVGNILLIRTRGKT